MGNGPSPEWDAHHGNPYSWSNGKKWTVMWTACIVTFIVGLNATSITTASDIISAEFDLGNSSVEYNFFAVTAWNAAAALVPLVTLPLMDTYGVRWGYMTCYVLFTIFLIPQALAHNFATLVVCRAVAGAVGGTLQNAADGIAANLFLHNHERVLPLTGYVFSLVFGVTMGPVLGAVVEPLDWRWIFWIQLILCGALLPAVLVFVKETRGSVLYPKYFPDDVDNAEEPGGSNKALEELYSTTTRSAILLTTELTVSLFTLWSSFAFGLVFISTQSIPLVFGSAFGWGAYQSGLVQSAIGIGQILGFGACLFQRHLYIQSARRNGEKPGVPIPEAILHLSIPTTPVALAGGLFMYGWSIYQPHWIVTAVGLALVGFASMVIINSASIYITDSYSTFAASAIAAVAFGENVFAAFLPLAAKPMYERLGHDWASSLLGFVGLLLTLAPLLLLCNGKKIRSKSTFKQ
ncbi:MFS multidrug transporter [Cordyceps javanica]|uniref:MFS multidrug transporter n=1 Tax=Cordyceps javanica TaxID=43265 RepID=A0A545VF61_9HYPO|nr:MFS multidrug transporter [Cordyceps javanica]TQW11443.1 MFS multidrug transporter [Cordyceps javanica]